jgi:SAM-dependent methyltransferase
MPYSDQAFDYWVSTMIDLLQPSSVLDIGAGAGKYGRMIRAKSNPTRITAIEIDPIYVEQFRLRELYDEVILADATCLIKQPRIRYDLVMIGDCIEHMRKSDGIDLLNFLIYRSGYICIVYPDRFVQDDWEGHAAEAHISTWSEQDFRGWDVLHHSWSGMHLFLIKGYLPSRMRITA